MAKIYSLNSRNDWWVGESLSDCAARQSEPLVEPYELSARQAENLLVADWLSGETKPLAALAQRRRAYPCLLATASLASVERARYMYVQLRDGREAGRAFARQCVKVYLAAIKSGRADYGRHFAFRRELIISAASFRALLNLEVHQNDYGSQRQRQTP